MKTTVFAVYVRRDAEEGVDAQEGYIARGGRWQGLTPDRPKLYSEIGHAKSAAAYERANFYGSTEIIEFTLTPKTAHGVQKPTAEQLENR